MDIYKKFMRSFAVTFLVLMLVAGTALRVFSEEEFQVEEQGDMLQVKGELDITPFLKYINGREWVADGDPAKTAVISGINWEDPATYTPLPSNTNAPSIIFRITTSTRVTADAKKIVFTFSATL